MHIMDPFMTISWKPGWHNRHMPMLLQTLQSVMLQRVQVPTEVSENPVLHMLQISLAEQVMQSLTLQVMQIPFMRLKGFMHILQVVSLEQVMQLGTRQSWHSEALLLWHWQTAT